MPTSKMELSAEIVNHFQSLPVFTKATILNISSDFEYTSGTILRKESTCVYFTEYD